MIDGLEVHLYKVCMMFENNLKGYRYHFQISLSDIT